MTWLLYNFALFTRSANGVLQKIGAQFHLSKRIRKLASKVMTEWLKIVTASIVHEEQTCGAQAHIIFFLIYQSDRYRKN